MSTCKQKVALMTKVSLRRGKGRFWLYKKFRIYFTIEVGSEGVGGGGEGQVTGPTISHFVEKFDSIVYEL